MIDIETYALAKAYTDKAIEGAGAIKGKNCVITEIEDVGNTHIVHFQWTLDDGTVETDTMTVEDGDLVEASETNGNIKINGVETQVYNDAEIKADIDAIDDIISTDEVTKEGNPLNFTTLSAQTAKSTILSLEPIQDLHGYDKPWVGGAGKNIIPNTYTSSTTADVTWTVNADGSIHVYSSGTTSLRSFSFGTLTGLSGEYRLVGCPAGGSSTTYELQLYSDSAHRDYGNGVNVSIESSDNAILQIIIRNGVSIDKTFYPMLYKVTGTIDDNFEPYENICPISGRTEIGILGCGKNLFGYTLDEIKALNTSGSWNNNTYTMADCSYKFNNDGTIDISGTPSTNSYVFMKPIDVEKLSMVTLSGLENTANVVWNAIELKNSANYTIASLSPSSTYKDSLIIDISQYPTAKYLLVSIKRKQTGQTISGTIKMQLEMGNARTSFESFVESNDLTISLGQTVYGGTLDVENGVLVVDGTITDAKNMTSITSIEQRTNTTKFWLYPLASPTSVEKRNQSLCSIAPYNDSILNNDLFGFYIITSYLESVCVSLPKDLAGTTQQSIRDYIANNPFYFYTPLLTPITINLTPHTIKLLEGVNNISTTGDKITLTYRDGSVATLGDLTSAVDELDGKIEDSKILTDTETGTKYRLVVTDGVLGIEEVTEPNALSTSPLSLSNSSVETSEESSEESNE